MSLGEGVLLRVLYPPMQRSKCRIPSLTILYSFPQILLKD